METYGQLEGSDDVASQRKLPVITRCVTDCISWGTSCRTIGLIICTEKWTLVSKNVSVTDRSIAIGLAIFNFRMLEEWPAENVMM